LNFGIWADRYGGRRVMGLGARRRIDLSLWPGHNVHPDAGLRYLTEFAQQFLCRRLVELGVVPQQLKGRAWEFSLKMSGLQEQSC
jgi:hypothetical protein